MCSPQIALTASAFGPGAIELDMDAALEEANDAKESSVASDVKDAA